MTDTENIFPTLRHCGARNCLVCDGLGLYRRPNPNNVISEAELRELAAKEANGFKVRYGVSQ